MPSRPSLYARWALEMRRHGFFRPGMRAGVAVSGGPDSVLLLHFMRQLATDMGFRLAAVHFNHHLRGEESDADEALVRRTADALGIECLCGGGEAGAIARRQGRNLEAVARELRYRYFFSLVDQAKLDCVATAHTANDQAETVLLRLLRGAATRGLAGIHPVLAGKVVRPFLRLKRGEVMEEVRARGLEYRVDSTNSNPRLRRNKIRLELLPLLSRDYNPEIVSLLSQFAARAREEEAVLEREARQAAQPWRVREGKEERIALAALRDFPPALGRRILRQMFESLPGVGHGLAHPHLDLLWQFGLEAQRGKVLTLPGGALARKESAWLVLSPACVVSPGSDFSYTVSFPGEIAIPEVGSVFHLKILERDPTGAAYNLSRRMALDPEKLPGELILRNWRPGDRFCPLGRLTALKLKEMLAKQKVPRESRKLWPVLLSGDEVVWVRGFPPARCAAAAEGTPRVLVIEEKPAE